MTDLKNMSVDELRDQISKFNPVSGCIENVNAYMAFDELARRLLEQEQRIHSLEKIEKIAEYSAHEYENIALRQRAEQAESALLACQAECTGLKQHMQTFVDRVERGEVRSRRTYAAFKEALSHSTGSKIEEDAKRYQWMKKKATFQNRNGPGLYWYLPRYLEGDEGDQLDKSIDDARAMEDK